MLLLVAGELLLGAREVEVIHQPEPVIERRIDQVDCGRPQLDGAQQQAHS